MATAAGQAASYKLLLARQCCHGFVIFCEYIYTVLAFHVFRFSTEVGALLAIRELSFIAD